MEKFVKFGIPALVIIITFIQMAKNHPGSGGTSGALGALFTLVFWGIFFTVLLIAGIIVWFKSKETYVLQSFVFSLIAMVATVLIYNMAFVPKKKVASPEEKAEHARKVQERTKAQAQEKAAKLDSLNLVLEKNPNDLVALEDRGLMRMQDNIISKPGAQDLEKAVENNTINNTIYIKLSEYYWRTQDFTKVESFITMTLEKDSNGVIKLEKHQRNTFKEKLEAVQKIIKEG